jgi:hypothetical protein
MWCGLKCRNSPSRRHTMSNAESFRAKRNYRDNISNIGWKDFMQGFMFPYDYDKWSIKEQRNYENGRLRAANYKQFTGKTPKKQVSLSEYKIVCVMFGNAIPQRRII